MRKVFYTAGQRTSPVTARGWLSDGTESEMETDVEDSPVLKSTRKKAIHQRSDSTDPSIHPSIATEMGGPAKKMKRGNAIVRQRQVSKDGRDMVGRKPLQKACAKADIGRVREILAESPDLEDRDYAGTTALHTAASEGHSEIVEALIKAGAVPDVRSGPQELDTPLIDAAANSDFTIVKILLDAGADPRVTNACGRIALDFALEAESVDSRIIDALKERTKALRKEGAIIINSPNSPSAPKGLFPAGFLEVKRPTAPAFLDVGKRSARVEIVRHAANGDLEYVGSALERGWIPNAEALVKAARYGHTEVVGLLLAFGLSADQKHEGTTSLREAVDRAHLSTAKLLIESGAAVTSDIIDIIQDYSSNDPIRTLIENSRPTSESEAEKVVISELKPEISTVEEEDIKECDTSPQNNSEKQRDSYEKTLTKIELKSIKAKKRNKSSSNGNSENFVNTTKSANDNKPIHHSIISPSSDLDDSHESSTSSNGISTSSNGSTEASKPKEVRSKTPPTPIEVWTERSNELNELSQLKEKQRKDRQARMLESLAMESRRKSETNTELSTNASTSKSSNALGNHMSNTDIKVELENSQPTVAGPRLNDLSSDNRPAKYNSGDSPINSPRSGTPDRAQFPVPDTTTVSATELASQEAPSSNGTSTCNTSTDSSTSVPPDTVVSVSHLPWSLRRLSCVGKPQNVSPLLVCELTGVSYFIDIQLALSLGDSKLHSKYPDLPKSAITASQKTSLWPFCRPWLCRPGSTADEIVVCRESFFDMVLCWIPVKQSLSKLFTNTPSMLTIQLELPSTFAYKSEYAELPMRWQRKVEAGW